MRGQNVTTRCVIIRFLFLLSFEKTSIKSWSLYSEKMTESAHENRSDPAISVIFGVFFGFFFGKCSF